MMNYHFCLKERNSKSRKASKQAFNHRLILKRVHRVIKLNQKNWLKLYIVMNTKLKKIIF